MSTIEDDLHSPELGHPTTPPRAPQLSTEPSESIAMDEEQEEEAEQLKKKRTVKKDMRKQLMPRRLERKDHAEFDDKEIKHQVIIRIVVSNHRFYSAGMNHTLIADLGFGMGTRARTAHTEFFLSKF